MSAAVDINQMLGSPSSDGNSDAWQQNLGISGMLIADTAAVQALQTGLNPIVASAGVLLYLALQLKHGDKPQDLHQLQATLVQQVNEFEERMRALQVRHEHIIGARYVMCTYLDEVIASSSWGASWSSCSLLVQFHSETCGGEKFFLLLDRLKETPAESRDLLELMFLCLSYGFSGRFLVIESGAQQLEILRNQLAEIIRQQRPSIGSELSEQWKGAAVKALRPMAIVPLWVSVILVTLILLSGYFFLTLRVNQHSDPVFSEIKSLRVRNTFPVVAPAVSEKPRLAGFLEPEIRQGLVSVTDYSDRSVITILGDGLFESASADVKDSAQPVLIRIASELKKFDGKILVTGHTDNQAISTLQFTSNWSLSKARAEAVQVELAKVIGTNRIKIEAKADSEPITKNDTPANRAKNRRVEITLYVTR